MSAPTCFECNGSGKPRVEDQFIKECYACDGSGHVGLSEEDIATLGALAARIESGEEDLRWDEHPIQTFAGNVDVHTKDGWVVTLFIDCNDWDYIDSVKAPDGRAWEFKDLFYGPVQLQQAVCEWWRKRGFVEPRLARWPPEDGPWPKVTTP